jgi:FkbM family methyltransferase
MLVWSQFLRSGDLFVDVGANIGTYSIWAADLGARVIALEPAEETCNLLAENVKINSYPIQLIRAAAGAVCGTAHFTQGLDDQNHIDSDGQAEVEIVTVDSIIGDRQVAGMKVDVEGFETDVLRGCERALSERRIALIQLEWNSTSQQAAHADRRPLANLLRSHGYNLYRPDENGILAPLTDINFGPDIFARPNV